ncbi:ABC transporter ATP-binding protein [Pelagibacterales bacterium SAG-MED06]|nr:ABC transporter ATP-binding protein [Pelagibacterales bacterium SAG-MED06]
MILIMTFLDTLGVASILPFVTILTEPSIIDKNLFLNTVFQYSKNFGVKNKEDFLFFSGFLVFLILLVSLSFKALTIYYQVRFAKMREYSIGRRLTEGYLNQSYIWFVGRHSADLAKTILTEVHTVVNGVMTPIIELITKILIASAILILLILTDVKLALIIGLTFGLFYGIILKLNHKFLKRIGQDRLDANKDRFTTISDAFGAAKEIKVSGLEQNYVEKFSNAALIFAKRLAIYKTLSQLPRYGIESLAFGGLLLAILYLMHSGDEFISVLPILSLYAFAGYRLLPALQVIYACISQLRFNIPALENLIFDIKNLKEYSLKKNLNFLPFNKEIELKNISYNYPESSRKSLKNINLKIYPKTVVGIVGVTGSGKTTLVDIILGLLQPDEGIIMIDNNKMDSTNSRAWQNSIGYVPQNIYLADDTLAENIAFGVKKEDINKKAIEWASKISNLHEFVMNELPKKYQTTIGERGVKLSGGQRQRIGIARALYNNPKVLILDEATSSLDNLTEKAVMDAINNLNNEITIILIAHRLETVKKCDLIYQLSEGKIIGKGSYESFINKDPSFNIAK